MIRTDDIDKILDCQARDRESIAEWCRRNDVDETVMHRLVAVYGFDRSAAVVGIDAFRLGHEARRADEPRSKGQPSRRGSRYGVEFVVVDRRDGRIVGGPTPARDEATGLAGAYNELDTHPGQPSHRA